MNRIILSASAALLCMAAGSAEAADWNNGAGSIKDRGQAAVPVPAPYPVYDGPSGWYMRLDAGIGREGNHGSSERGLVYGAGNATDSYSASGDGFGSSSGWFGSNGETSVNYGLGIGYNWGHNLRSDVTLDRRTNTTYRMRGTYQYDNYTPAVAPAPGYALPAAPAVPMRIDGTTSDDTSLKSGVLMANTYYDWKNQSALTPYVGVGLGVGYLDFSRVHSTSDTSCDPTELPLPCATRTDHRSFSGSGSDGKFVWAAALHAGFSYAFTNVTSLDLNYRMLYMPGTTVGMSVNGATSRVSINDILDHEFRAGLRWNIN